MFSRKEKQQKMLRQTMRVPNELNLTISLKTNQNSTGEYILKNTDQKTAHEHSQSNAQKKTYTTKL